MDPSRCPHCQGDLRAKVVGEMQDKRLECAHCGTEIDVLDEFSIEDGESETFVDGRGRRVVRSTKRVRTRRDLPGGADGALEHEVRSKLDVGPSSVEIVVDRVAREGVFEALRGPGGLAKLLSGTGLDAALSAETADELRRTLGLPSDAPIFFQRAEDETNAQVLLSKALADLGPQARRAGTWTVRDTLEPARRFPRVTTDVPDPWPVPARTGATETWKTLAAVGFGVLITLLVLAVL